MKVPNIIGKQNMINASIIKILYEVSKELVEEGSNNEILQQFVKEYEEKERKEKNE